MKTIHIKGAAARNFMAALAVANDGAKALDNTTGPMREAVQAELDRAALTCLSCGAKKYPGVDLPCGH